MLDNVGFFIISAGLSMDNAACLLISSTSVSDLIVLIDSSLVS